MRRLNRYNPNAPDWKAVHTQPAPAIGWGFRLSPQTCGDRQKEAKARRFAKKVIVPIS